MPYDHAPMLIYWEVTRACDLACRHCRAEAIAARDSRELNTTEGFRLLDQLHAFGELLPHIVITGGDPLKRPDLFDLIGYACHLGFSVALTPSGTYALTHSVVTRLKEAGIWMLSVSLDGSTAERHDAIRGVPGSYQQTVQAIGWARAAGLPLQINTLVCAETQEDVPAIGQLLADLQVQRWSLFFLVPIGRGRVLREVTPNECEHLLRWLWGFSQTAPYVIKTTEAHHYRRIAVEESRRNGHDRVPPPADSLRRGFGIRDGAGIMFISHVGEIHPAGFLPLHAGDVREDDPVQVYREASLFQSLRDADGFKGKCGYCEFSAICGGSRARAYAYTGDPLASDPLCPYEPALRRAPHVLAR